MLAACSTDDAALSRPEVEKTKIDLRICCGDFRTKKAEEVKQSVDILVSFTAIDELNRALCSLPLCLLNCSLSMEGVVSFDHDIDVDKIGLSEVDDVQEQEEIM
ncbi:hypothetical protein RHMOL_Rhmol06G0085000 [Rhododendron molle]|uniref:Uncharacterized protein n=1 Tax=Rhododendron molle TaxID=49168 RepID=A0ACC0NAH0_RHOML|nr:hypothetical protein RHMOL_Rhmol06G0085000 [Rhododendron molle]